MFTRAELKVTDTELKVTDTEPNLRFPAVFCDNLRVSAMPSKRLSFQETLRAQRLKKIKIALRD